MTRTTSQPVRVEAATPAARTLEIRWDLSLVAGRELEQRLESADEADPVCGVALELTTRGASDARACGRLALVRRSGRLHEIDTVGPARATWTIDHEARLDHIDAPGVLSATLRRDRADDAPPRAIFTRSPLLAALGIGGGRYAVRSVSLDGAD